MAIERMEMMNLVGHLEDMDKILREMVLLECFQPVQEIQQRNIASTLDDLNMQQTESPNWVHVLSDKWEFREAQMKLDLLMEKLGIEKKVLTTNFDTNYSVFDVVSDVNIMYERFSGYLGQLEAMEKETERLERLRVMNLIKNVSVDLNDLNALQHFGYRIGAISREHRQKLSMNYENISAAVMHIGPWKGREIYLLVYPKALEQENSQILRSIDFESFDILPEYMGVPEDALNRVESRMLELKTQEEELRSEMERFRHSFEGVICDCYGKLRMEDTLVEIRNMITVTRNFFFLSGWVPIKERKKLVNLMESHGQRVILSFSGDEDTDARHVRPTRLKNHWLVRPFEFLVKTYGTPGYYETDPTWFIGLTYMLLFGMMFGDLGQGLVLLCAGIALSVKVSAVFGGILSRIGVSSMVFGFVYDSFFGYEHLISKVTERVAGPHVAERIHFHAMENINTMLLISVVVGVGLLAVGCSIGIYTKIKNGEYVEGLLGRNGVTGLALYFLLLGAVYGIVTGVPLMGTGLMVTAVALLTLLIALREPLAAIVTNHRPVIHEGPVMFTVEAFFETFEVYLGYMSNTLSFVRVGAFALNHIGLFMAFHILADVMNSPMGDASMFVIGNLIVIGLEGMIVMIQGLRLLYYEVFSKYFAGDGTDFKAVSLKA